jgi:hypothetical protein
MMKDQTDYRSHKGNGYYLNGGKWWAVVREGTINILVSTYDTMEEAKVAYEAAQKAWDEDRISVAKWKEGSRYGLC